jgi:formylglycine-generating enzyme required for sulfatase activity/predicted GIY-YIG superfamily endonuclease
MGFSRIGGPGPAAAPTGLDAPASRRGGGWFVYVVRCCDGSLYTGISTDVAARVARHNAGLGARYTRARRPVELIYTERKRSRSTALRREAAIKALPRRQKDDLVAGRAVPGLVRARKLPAIATSAALAVLIVLSLPAAGLRAAGRLAVDRVAVAAGPFVQGSAHGDEDERPPRARSLPAFAIDRTEVTRAAYASCVAAHRCKPIPPELAGPAGSDGQLPITNVSWFDARDFCAFAGARLPSEAEWEKAARGPDGREYPWGSDAACERANWGNFEGEGPCAATNPGFPVAVGRYADGASPYGALDMAGNVWEWVGDSYDEDPKRRVVRGGSCCSYFVPPRAANRNAWAPNYRGADLGFRCAAAR